MCRRDVLTVNVKRRENVTLELHGMVCWWYHTPTIAGDGDRGVQRSTDRLNKNYLCVP